MAAHRLTDVTIVDDAGMVSDSNKKAIEAAGLSFVIGARIPDVLYVVSAWQLAHPGGRAGRSAGVDPADASLTHDGRKDHTISYQYRADRTRRTLRGIDEQVGKAQKAIDGKTAIKRNGSSR